MEIYTFYFQPARRSARVKRNSARRCLFFPWMLMAGWMRRSWLSTLVTYFTASVRMMRKTRNVLMTAAELRFEPWRATHAGSFTPSFIEPHQTDAAADLRRNCFPCRPDPAIDQGQ